MRFTDGAVGCDDGVGCVDGDGGCVVVQSEKIALDSGWRMETTTGWSRTHARRASAFTEPRHQQRCSEAREHVEGARPHAPRTPSAAGDMITFLDKIVTQRAVGGR
jgi:hypothetical protein